MILGVQTGKGATVPSKPAEAGGELKRPTYQAAAALSQQLCQGRRSGSSPVLLCLRTRKRVATLAGPLPEGDIQSSNHSKEKVSPLSFERPLHRNRTRTPNMITSRLRPHGLTGQARWPQSRTTIHQSRSMGRPILSTEHKILRRVSAKMLSLAS